MSPILVRPVREQFEHDRVIRLLEASWRRRFDVGANPGSARTASVRFGIRTLVPDLIVTTSDRARKLHRIVEVETNESINHLEAIAQWAHFARVRAAFHLYVPAGAVDVTRRLCAEEHVAVAEIWSYHAVGAQMRFTMAYRAPAHSRPVRFAKTSPKAAAQRSKPRVTARRKTTGRRVKPARPARRPARAPKPKGSRALNTSRRSPKRPARAKGRKRR